MSAVTAKPVSFVASPPRTPWLSGLLKRLTGKTAKKKKPKKVAGRENLPTTQVDQTLETAASLILEDGAKRLLVHGDSAFLNAARARLPALELTWVSNVLADIAAGAANAAKIDYRAHDGVLVGGGDAALSYRFTLRELARVAQDKPIYWVAEKFEFCRGTLPAPADADELEALIFNHFAQFFGLKEPLHFRIEIYHGSEVKRIWRTLKPNESMLIRVSEHFPHRRHPVAVSAMICHPFLTQGRHYRFRACADVLWKGSFTTLHSAHEFRRDPEETAQFRIGHERVRAGRLVATLPNYERNIGSDEQVEFGDGAERQRRPRERSAYIAEIAAERPMAAERAFFDCLYKGYGGSFWFAQERLAGEQELKASISGNHHIATPRFDSTNRAMAPEERARFAALEAEGFAFDLHALPILGPEEPLRFGFDCDAANPPFQDFLLYWFDRDGKALGRSSYRKEQRGTVFAEELRAQWTSPQREQAAVVAISPDWLKVGIRRKGFKVLPDLVVEDRRTGDRDVTEFQSCWRNLGVVIADFPHWLTPHLSVVGRTNLFARARAGRGYRTGLLIFNGSGRLAYDAAAKAEIMVRNLNGQAMLAEVGLGAFCSKLVWLDEVMPDLERHLSPDGVGALILQSGDADLNAQVVTVNAAGAVSLQHLWGY